jgi:dsDNA-specific endonuclease/ATPase MutS2
LLNSKKQQRFSSRTLLTDSSESCSHATSKSLVILDELGRGTSTFDGISIAYGVADHIRSKIRCRCLFSTHYHMLCHDLAGKENVSLYHMSCSVSRESREITFDYKFLPGVCNKSFGINVAHMAGLPVRHLVEIPCLTVLRRWSQPEQNKYPRSSRPSFNKGNSMDPCHSHCSLTR